jgi:RNA polymerase sigma-70 factor (ECF subfamily)
VESLECACVLLRLFSKPDPDASLVEAAAKGDVRAFDALVYRYQGHLTQFVRARLDSAIDADDVAQEVFVSAWRSLPGFNGRSRFKTWLFGIAVHHCAEALRKHRRLQLILGEASAAQDDWATAGQRTDPFDWSMALAERDALRRRLGQLSVPERQVLELYYYAELNLPEISKLLDVNLSTLKYRFYQAHNRLRNSSDAAPADSASSKWRLP